MNFKRITILTLLVLFCNAAVVFADLNLSDITNALEANYDAINDMSSNIVIDSTDNNHDISSGTAKYKEAESSKARVDTSAPESSTMICDGTGVDLEGKYYSKTTFVTTDNEYVGWLSRFFRETDIQWILDNNTFTLVSGTTTVNTVTCRKITSTAFDLYVDDSCYEKVIRIDAKSSGNVVRRYNLSGYEYLESTAYYWDICEATDAPGADLETYDITLNNININENLSDNLFELPT